MQIQRGPKGGPGGSRNAQGGGPEIFFDVRRTPILGPPLGKKFNPPLESRHKERGIAFAYAFGCDIFVPLRNKI